MSKRIVRVTFSDGETVAVRGRLADFIFWMVRNAHRIEPVKQGELTLNWTEDEQGVGNFRPTIRSTMSSEKFSV